MYLHLPQGAQMELDHLLLQQCCDCNPKNAPICCPDGWRLVHAGSRFTEAGYSPT